MKHLGQLMEVLVVVSIRPNAINIQKFTAELFVKKHTGEIYRIACYTCFGC